MPSLSAASCCRLTWPCMDTHALYQQDSLVQPDPYADSQIQLMHSDRLPLRRAPFTDLAT